MRLTTRLHNLILRAVREAKTYDPVTALGYIEDEITKPESQAIESFLRWCLARRLRFGWNLPRVWFSWRVHLKRKEVSREQNYKVCHR